MTGRNSNTYASNTFSLTYSVCLRLRTVAVSSQFLFCGPSGAMFAVESGLDFVWFSPLAFLVSRLCLICPSRSSKCFSFSTSHRVLLQPGAINPRWEFLWLRSVFSEDHTVSWAPPEVT